MNSYLDDRKAINRLKKEYLQHKKLIIGFDFDNTIYDYHKENLELTPIINLLKRCSKLKFIMCLYTIDNNLYFKRTYTRMLGINIDCVNTSPVILGNGKPYFNILLDDRAGLSASYNILLTTLNELNI